jgi:CDP-glucose 4,6-dehydratase
MKNIEILKTKAQSGPILVTGHTGFKGTWMTLLLESLGIEVVGLSLPATTDSLYTILRRESRIREMFVDIRMPDLTAAAVSTLKPSLVIHMAADPLVLESYQQPRKTFETNVLGTVNLLDACRRFEVEHVQVITTDKVYDNLNTGKRFVETDSLKGKDPYSASKVGTEAVVSAWKQLAEVIGGTKVHSVRAGNVIGGGDSAANRLLPDVIRSIQSGESLSIRNPSSTRPWQHVLDPLQGYLMALSFNVLHEKQEDFNFGPSEPSLQVRDVLEIVCKRYPDFIWTEAQETKLKMESTRLDLDSQKAIDLLNWHPKLTQQAAIESTLAWWASISEDSQPPEMACYTSIEALASGDQ